MFRAAIWAPLRFRRFRLLFAGQVVSDLGDWLSYLALIALIVYKWQLGATALAALSVAMILPWALVAPAAGVWVDRWPRRTVMVTCDLIRAILALGLVWAPNLPVVLALIAVLGIVSTFFQPARQASIRDVVPEHDLLPANSLSQLSVQAGKVMGPALGGVLVSFGGPSAAFVANAVTFLLSAAFLTQLPLLAPAATPTQTGAAEQRSFWREFSAGLAFIVRTRPLVVAVVGMSAVMFVTFAFESLGALALGTLGVDESTLGLAVGSIGLGTAIGAGLIGQWGSRVNPFRVMAMGVIASGVMVATLGVAVTLRLNGAGLLALPMWFVIGLGSAAMFVPYAFILQVETPSDLMGRVSASAQGVQTVFQVLAPVIGAVLAEAFGVGSVFSGAGLALVFVGVVVLFIMPAIRVQAGGEVPVSSS